MDSCQADWGLQPQHRDWLEAFRQAHGRAPRVLGIGNIANNAFKNSVALRKFGVEADVLCHGYFHIMGCPEWEEAKFDADGIDNFNPDWQSVDLHGYERPRWFAQGQLGTAMDYLIDRHEGGEHLDVLWAALTAEQQPQKAFPTSYYKEPSLEGDALRVATRLAMDFAITFPNRRDPLSPEEILDGASYVMEELPRVRRLLSHYDFVIGYSTDGLFPLLAAKDGYIAFEHGTIRVIPFDRSFQGRMCALTYARAGDVQITNCDNILAAKRLNLQSYRFVPHAILEDWRQAEAAPALRDRLLRENDADFIVFHPARQHWAADRNLNFDKGNDILITAFARFVREVRPKALLVMVDWGVSVNETKALIDQLGVADRVAWISPIPIRKMTEYVAASDVLADQFIIGAWGAIMPLGLMLATPVLIHLDEALHEWCFPEMPPVLNANAVDTVFDSLVSLTDSAAAKALGSAGRDWYDRYHSMEVVTARLLDSFRATEVKDEFSARPIDDSTRAIALQLASAAFEIRDEGLARRAGAPSGGKVVHIYGHDKVVCYDYWSNAGASVSMSPGGAQVTTPNQAWHYAAGVHLDLTGINFNHEHCWVRVRLTDVRGQLGVCVYSPDEDKIYAQEMVEGRQSVREVVLRIENENSSLLLLRTGAREEGALAVFLSAELITAPAYQGPQDGAGRAR